MFQDFLLNPLLNIFFVTKYRVPNGLSLDQISLNTAFSKYVFYFSKKKHFVIQRVAICSAWCIMHCKTWSGFKHSRTAYLCFSLLWFPFKDDFNARSNYQFVLQCTPPLAYHLRIRELLIWDELTGAVPFLLVLFPKLLLNWNFYVKMTERKKVGACRNWQNCLRRTLLKLQSVQMLRCVLWIGNAFMKIFMDCFCVTRL